jgi:hypothetical protein
VLGEDKAKIIKIAEDIERKYKSLKNFASVIETKKAALE